jgi:hypothetical protein
MKKDLFQEILEIEKKMLELSFEKKRLQYQLKLNKSREMIALRKKGLTYEEIGKINGLTRQRAHQLLNI